MATLKRPTVEQDLTAQLRPLSLSVTAGTDGYRIAFEGHDYFSEISSYHDMGRAFADMREAAGSTAALMTRVFMRGS